MDTLLIMFWIFDIAALLCMLFVYFSQRHCSKVSLAFINIIPPAALALALPIGALTSHPLAFFAAAYLFGCIFFYAGNQFLMKKGRFSVPVYPSGLVALLSIPIWAATVGAIGFFFLVQFGFAH